MTYTFQRQESVRVTTCDRHLLLPCIAPVSIHDEGDMSRDGAGSQCGDDEPLEMHEQDSVEDVRDEIVYPVKLGSA